MSDDLVARLRHSANEVYGTHPCGLMSEAADRIAELESRLQEAKSLLLQAHDQIFRLHDNSDVAARNLITKIRVGFSGTLERGKE